MTHVTVCNLLWLELGVGRRGLITSDLNHETTGLTLVSNYSNVPLCL